MPREASVKDSHPRLYHGITNPGFICLPDNVICQAKGYGIGLTRYREDALWRHQFKYL